MSHPLDKFRFCPVCGSEAFEVNNFKSKKCRHCGFTYYANPCSATVAFILNEKGQLLVARRGKEPAKGTLDLVGGFVDMDETSEQGMLREIKEETGMEVNECRYLFSIPNIYEYSNMPIHTLDMFYEVHVEAGAEAHAADDAADSQWIPLSRVRAELFGLHSISQAVRKFTASVPTAV